MKRLLSAIVSLGLFVIGAAGQQSPPVYVAQPPAPPMVTTSSATYSSPDASEASPVPPPSEAPKLSAVELEKLAAPIALYPDPLLAVLLPASVYPLEIVQAARFIQDTNNIAILDGQPWDSNVKTLAQFPTVLEQLNQDLPWTIQLGQAFVEQPDELMDSIQTLRGRAQSAGTLQSTPQQVVTVTNAVVERIYEQQIVYVTNTIIEIQPSNPQIIYVPVYNPTIVYAPAPVYVNPLTPLITFGVGVAVGAVIVNNCNWYYGGVWVGGRGVVVWGGGRYPYYPPPPGYRPPYYRHPPHGYRPPPPGYRPPGYPPPSYRPPGSRPSAPGGGPPGGNKPTQLPAGGRPQTRPATGEPWQPDANRRPVSGGPSTRPSAGTSEARGWGPGSGGTRPTHGPTTGTVGNRPTTGTVPNRPATTPGPAPTPSPGAPGGTPGQRPANPGQSGNRGSAAPSQGTRPGAQGTSRPPPTGGSQGAFGGVSNGSAARDYSNRGNASRGGNTSRPSGGGRNR